ncbi:MAG: hypothetical protein ACOC33_03810 [bacterium]
MGINEFNKIVVKCDSCGCVESFIDKDDIKNNFIDRQEQRDVICKCCWSHQANYNYISKDIFSGVIDELDSLDIFTYNYTIVLRTRENEFDAYGFDNIDALKDYIYKWYRYPDGSNWEIAKIYDNKNKIEMNYNIEMVVTLS